MRHIALLVIAGLSAFECLAQAKPDAELSYALGTELGQRLRNEIPALELDQLIKGLRHAYQGDELTLSNARIAQLLSEHEVLVEKAAETRFLVSQKAAYGVRELAGGVLVSELQKGRQGTRISGKEVQVSYVGKLADGRQFDASEQPQWFKLDSLITGWQTALREMPVGAKWRIVVPSDQAYGAEGAGDRIPPFAPLVFELELLDSR